MTGFEFTVPGEPASKARPRFDGRGSKSRTYTPAKTKAAEAQLAALFRASGGRFEPDSEVTFAVKITFYNGTRQRRDVDNMIKLVLDGLNGVAWVDDTQVMEVMGRKKFTTRAEARTEVGLEPIGRMDRLTKQCEHCKKDFPTYESLRDQRFCSRICGNSARQAARERTCDECGRSFLAHGGSRETRFCSRECQSKSGWTEVACSRCGTEFKRRRCHVRATNYCSTTCRDTARTEGRRGKAKGTCHDCGGPVTKKQYERCQSCRWAHVASTRGSNLDRPRDHEITLTLTTEDQP